MTHNDPAVYEVLAAGTSKNKDILPNSYPVFVFAGGQNLGGVSRGSEVLGRPT